MLSGWLLRPSLLALALFAVSVHAPARAESPPGAWADVRVANRVGATFSESGGLSFDAGGLLRMGFLGVGGHAAARLHVPVSSFGVAADAGLVWRGERLRFELLGRYGRTWFDRVGGRVGFGKTDPGIDVALPFAGGELSASYLLALRRRGHFAPGLSLFLERDLENVSRSYEYEECSYLYYDDCETIATSAEAGWLRVGVMLSVALQFELTRRPAE